MNVSIIKIEDNYWKYCNPAAILFSQKLCKKKTKNNTSRSHAYIIIYIIHKVNEVFDVYDNPIIVYFWGGYTFLPSVNVQIYDPPGVPIKGLVYLDIFAKWTKKKKKKIWNTAISIRRINISSFCRLVQRNRAWMDAQKASYEKPYQSALRCFLWSPSDWHIT